MGDAVAQHTYRALQLDLPGTKDRSCYGDRGEHLPAVRVSLGSNKCAPFSVCELPQVRRRVCLDYRKVHEAGRQPTSGLVPLVSPRLTCHTPKEAEGVRLIHAERTLAHGHHELVVDIRRACTLRERRRKRVHLLPLLALSALRDGALRREDDAVWPRVFACELRGS